MQAAAAGKAANEAIRIGATPQAAKEAAGAAAKAISLGKKSEEAEAAGVAAARAAKDAVRAGVSPKAAQAASEAAAEASGLGKKPKDAAREAIAAAKATTKEPHHITYAVKQ